MFRIRPALRQAHLISALKFGPAIGGNSFSTRRHDDPRDSRLLHISDQVLDALRGTRKPVVALESAIITHGMPYPKNIETALNVEKIIRDLALKILEKAMLLLPLASKTSPYTMPGATGVVPATIGVLNGKLTVGLSESEIEFLGSTAKHDGTQPTTPTVKVSRRDLAYVCSQKLHGGTTVSGTIIAAERAGIPIFVTGGLGGVHRDGHLTFDISADLDELGGSEIAVVSSGVKSILDIEKTLEYLETKGVCVCVLKRGENDDCSETNSIDGEAGRNTGGAGASTTPETPSNIRNEEGEKKKKPSHPRINSSCKFPSFFTPESPYNAPYAIGNEREAAEIVHWSREFGTRSAILIAVPIPNEHAASGSKIEAAILEALERAKKAGIAGRDVTPFILRIVNEVTGGDSLVANKHLIEHNARVGATIALELFRLEKEGQGGERDPSSLKSFSNKSSSSSLFASRAQRAETGTRPAESWKIMEKAASKTSSAASSGGKSPDNVKQGRPVVVGGASLDFIMRVQENAIVNDGRTHDTRIEAVAGGVGRNMAEALAKLGHNPLLISCIGHDFFGDTLLKDAATYGLDQSGIRTSEIGTPTAVYTGVLNKFGECLHGLGDMRIHSEISSAQVSAHLEDAISSSPLLVMDGNLSPVTMETLMRICLEHQVPVWFEPTELRKAIKLVHLKDVSVWPALRYLSPNLGELAALVEAKFGGGVSKRVNDTICPDSLAPLISRAFSMFTGLDVILLTAGSQGFWVIQKGEEEQESRCQTDGDLLAEDVITSTTKTCVLDDEEGGQKQLVLTFRHYGAPQINAADGPGLVSVSGAGDCLNAGFISGLLRNNNIHQCSLRGRICAAEALKTGRNVPHVFRLTSD